MRILRNYLLKEFFSPLFMSLGILTFVLLLGNLIKITELVISKGVDLFSVSKLFLFMMPYLLTYTLPIAALTATLLALGRLSSDNEIIAIRASGINLFRIISPLLTVGAILSLLLVVFNDRLIPYAHFATRKTLIEIGIKNPAAALEPGVFIKSFDKYILFIYKIADNKLYNITIYEPQENKPTRTIIAKRGEFLSIPEKGTLKLKLIDGTADEPDEGNPNNFYKLNFKTYFINLNLAQTRNPEDLEKKPKDMTIGELKTEIKKLRSEGINPAPLITEIHGKIALAFSCIVFILIGSSMAIITRRREKSINLGIAVIIVGVYYLLLIGMQALSIQGLFNPHLAMWIPNILLGIIGAILIHKICAS